MSVCVVFAQDNTDKGAILRGKVIGITLERNPVEGAEVKMISTDGKELIEKTDADGSFKFIGVPSGFYEINVTRNGYRDLLGKPLVLNEGEDAFQTFRIVKVNLGKNQDTIPPILLESFLQHLAEDIVNRYNLDKSTVDLLKISVLEAVNSATTLQKDRIAHAISLDPQRLHLEVLVLLLTELNTKSAFAKHLTKTQLQDYIVFSKSREQQMQQAIVQLLTAFLDQLLTLSSKQHEPINELLYEWTESWPHLATIAQVATIVRGTPLQQVIVFKEIVFTGENWLTDSLKGVLTEKQFEVWNVFLNIEKEMHVSMLAMMNLVEMANDGDQNIQDLIKKDDETNENKFKPLIQKLAEVVLDAHTEQFGKIDGAGKQRLKIVFKSIIPQYIQAQNEYVDKKMLQNLTYGQIMDSVRNGKNTRKEAVKKLKGFVQEIGETQNTDQRDSEGKFGNHLNRSIYKVDTISVFIDSISHLLNNPLYQQTLKDIIPEKAFEEYKNRQIERDQFQQQAAPNFILEYYDSLLLLNTTQRKQLKSITDKLTLSSMSYSEFQLMLLEVNLSIDPEMLGPWQQNIYK